MDINEKLLELSKISNSITLYQNVDTKNIYKGIGRVIGTFNEELLEVLKHTNGASILGYCLLGFKNTRLGVDLDKYVFELYQNNSLLAGKIIGFMLDEVGGTFGYLLEKNMKNTPIVYINEENPNKMKLIGSSFNQFFSTFLEDVEYTLRNNSDGILLNVEIDNWPMDINHWLSKDKKLLKLFEQRGVSSDGVIHLK